MSTLSFVRTGNRKIVRSVLTLTHEDIITLEVDSQADQVVMIPAPREGGIIQLVRTLVVVDTPDGGYAGPNGDTLKFYYGIGVDGSEYSAATFDLGTTLVDFLRAGQSIIQIVAPASASRNGGPVSSPNYSAFSALAAQPIMLKWFNNDVGDLTGGGPNNRIRIIADYYVDSF